MGVRWAAPIACARSVQAVARRQRCHRHRCNQVSSKARKQAPKQHRRGAPAHRARHHLGNHTPHTRPPTKRMIDSKIQLCEVKQYLVEAKSAELAPQPSPATVAALAIASSYEWLRERQGNSAGGRPLLGFLAQPLPPYYSALQFVTVPPLLTPTYRAGSVGHLAPQCVTVPPLLAPLLGQFVRLRTRTAIHHCTAPAQ